MQVPNGNATTATVKALGQQPALLALVVLVGVLIYFFADRVSQRLDRMHDAISECCACQDPRP